MKTAITSILVLALAGCANLLPSASNLSILVDLDPASKDRTVIIESITADRGGVLYVADRVTGNVMRVDPKDPKPVVVGRVGSRQINGQNTAPNPAGMAFNAQGDLFIAAGAFGEIVRLRASDLNPASPGVAQTFITGVPGANGIEFDSQQRLYISGGASGNIFRAGPNGGAAQTVATLERFNRTLPDGVTQQAIVANGLAIDAAGVLHVADTARGAVWRIAFDGEGRAQRPALLARSAALEGADGLAFDARGQLWVAANELNALVRISPSGEVTEVARNDASGPLEFPAALVFVGATGYVANFDTPRRINLDPGSTTTARAGIGASILRVTR
ncbi:MAG: SMP-30/gluconolactonase/LRE family protein [Pseudomonadota bacterium]